MMLIFLFTLLTLGFFTYVRIGGDQDNRTKSGYAMTGICGIAYSLVTLLLVVTHITGTNRLCDTEWLAVLFTGMMTAGILILSIEAIDKCQTMK